MEDAPPLTRRALRARAAQQSTPESAEQPAPPLAGTDTQTPADDAPVDAGLSDVPSAEPDADDAPSVAFLTDDEVRPADEPDADHDADDAGRPAPVSAGAVAPLGAPVFVGPEDAADAPVRAAREALTSPTAVVAAAAPVALAWVDPAALRAELPAGATDADDDLLAPLTAARTPRPARAPKTARAARPVAQTPSTPPPAAEPTPVAAAVTAVAPVSAEPAAPTTASAARPDSAPRARRGRAGVLAPVAVVAGLAVGYTGAAAALPAPAPAVTQAELAALTGPASAVAWPAEGTAGVALAGFAAAGSTTDAGRMASITKLVTALVVLERQPLEAGEAGPDYQFTPADRREYWAYVEDDQSALNVPDDGSLSYLQLLQGMLIGSASNYANRLVDELWDSPEAYVADANAWLAAEGVDGVTVADASGISRDNTATPQGLAALAQKALAHPVIADIVATRSIELPGAGEVENTNALLEDPAVVGLKTGSYAGAYALAAARTATVGEREITLFATVTDQPSDDDRFDEAARLLDELEAELEPTTLPAGSVVGRAETAWGTSADLVTTGDASLLLWNGATAEPTVSIDLGETRAPGADIGDVAVSGPAGDAAADVELAGELGEPGFWWRLTHPLQLFGLAG